MCFDLDMDKLYAQVEKTNVIADRMQPFKRSTSIDTVNVKLAELDVSELEVVEKLGEGQFGEIHLCRLHEHMEENAQAAMVAVKFLRQDCDEVTRSDFEHEARILTSLNDVNLVRVLGVCYDDTDDMDSTSSALQRWPICMVCEYTEVGDLCQFLQDHVAETTLSKSPNVPTLRLVKSSRIWPLNAKMALCFDLVLLLTRLFLNDAHQLKYVCPLVLVTAAWYIWPHK